MSEKTNLISDDEVFYVELNLSGTFKTLGKDREAVIKKLTRLMNNLIQKSEMISVEHNIQVASEEDIMHTFLFNYSESGIDN